MDEKLWWGQWRETKLQGIQAGKSRLKNEKLSLSTCPVQAILPPAPESETEPKGEDKAEENAS